MPGQLPVYIGFGPIGVIDAGSLIRLIFKVMKKSGRRALDSRLKDGLDSELNKSLTVSICLVMDLVSGYLKGSPMYLTTAVLGLRRLA